MQLLLKVPVLLSNDEKRYLEILVDTGAEANLVRIGLLPDDLFFTAARILKFLTANGQRLAGAPVLLKQLWDLRKKKMACDKKKNGIAMRNFTKRT